MLDIQNGKERIKVKFKHANPGQFQQDKNLKALVAEELEINPEIAQALTLCFIDVFDRNMSKEEWKKAHIVSMAACSKSDRFTRKTGRKIALARALESFDKPFRTLVWEKYWEVTNV